MEQGKRSSYLGAFAGMVGILMVILITVIWKHADKIDQWVDDRYDNSLPEAYHQKKALDKQQKLDAYRAYERIPQYDAVWRGIVETTPER